MTKCVEKLNGLTSTRKAQKYYCNYKLGKTIMSMSKRHHRGIGMAAISKNFGFSNFDLLIGPIIEKWHTYAS